MNKHNQLVSNSHLQCASSALTLFNQFRDSTSATGTTDDRWYYYIYMCVLIMSTNVYTGEGGLLRVSEADIIYGVHTRELGLWLFSCLVPFLSYYIQRTLLYTRRSSWLSCMYRVSRLDCENPTFII